MPVLAQKPAVVISQDIILGKSNGGVLSGTSPAGTTIGLTTTGNIIAGNTYGGQVVSISSTTGMTTVLGSFSSAQAIAVDSANNIYVTTYGSTTIIKIPYLANGTYPAISTSTTTQCTGNDTVECNVKALTSTYIYGYEGVTFDASGNFYFVTSYNPYYSGANSSNGEIWKCNAACFASAVSGTTGTAVLLYQEPAATATSIVQTGGLAVDTLGDIFFTDSTYTSASNYSNLNSSTSSLRELPVASTTTGYAAAPTTLYTYTPTTASNYDDELDAVAVGQNNTVYFATQNTGLFGMLNNNGTVDATSIYATSPQGAKTLITDRAGRFYGINYVNSVSADAGTFVSLGIVNATTAAVGATSSTTGISVALNSGVTCTTAPTTTITSSTAEFSGTAGNCAATGLISAPVNPVTLSFTPSGPGTRTATLTATSGSNTGTATVTGVATGGTVATPTFSPAGGTYTSKQTVTITDATAGATIYYTTNGTAPTTASTVYTGAIPVAASETINAIAVYSGSTNSAVATATYTIASQTAQTITFPQPTTPVQYGAAPITLAATSSSGLPVTYTVNGPATLNGSTLTFTGAGTVTITASQAGNATYAAATPVIRTVTVNGGSAQTITFRPFYNFVRATTPTIPLLAYSTSGLAITYTVTGPATVNSNNTLTLTGAGTVTVTASQSGNTTYAAAPSVTRTFSVQ